MKKEFHKNSENFRLSRKQEQAILELVNPANKTLVRIAKKIGVTERTLYNWLNLPHFNKRLAQERKKLAKQGFDTLKANVNLAALTLGDLLRNKSPNIRLRASQVIIENTFKLLERERLIKSRNPFDEYNDAIDLEGDSVKSMYQLFVEMPKGQLELIKKNREEWDSVKGEAVKLKEP